MAKQYDALMRLLLVGDTGVGKTCLICQYASNEFHENHVTTIGKPAFIVCFVYFAVVWYYMYLCVCLCVLFVLSFYKIVYLFWFCFIVVVLSLHPPFIEKKIKLQYSSVVFFEFMNRKKCFIIASNYFTIIIYYMNHRKIVLKLFVFSLVWPSIWLDYRG